MSISALALNMYRMADENHGDGSCSVLYEMCLSRKSSDRKWSGRRQNNSLMFRRRDQGAFLAWLEAAIAETREQAAAQTASSSSTRGTNGPKARIWNLTRGSDTPSSSRPVTSATRTG